MESTYILAFIQRFALNALILLIDWNISLLKKQKKLRKQQKAPV
jgi:hypothetical protein